MSPLLSSEDVQHHHRILLRICAELEHIADLLPGPVPVQSCIRLSREVVAVVNQTHAQEEQTFLPVLASSSRIEFRQMAARLRREHDFDQEAASEIAHALEGLATGKPQMSADATGYLLRSFFESVRRHVGTEQDLILLVEDLGSEKELLH